MNICTYICSVLDKNSSVQYSVVINNKKGAVKMRRDIEKRIMVRGDGRGLPKIRIICAKCRSIIDFVDRPCPKCSCVVFYERERD